uniref:Pogo transposable element derived with ZNF domain b n=1 Tax=Oryzias latipes TaxID=8090 RepID=A0A3P9I0D4_ORYLA
PAVSPPRTVSSCGILPPPISTPSSSPLCLPVEATPTASAPPTITPAPPLILTQTSGGTFLLPAAGSGGRQPIFLTTQVWRPPSFSEGGVLVIPCSCSHVCSVHDGENVEKILLVWILNWIHFSRQPRRPAAPPDPPDPYLCVCVHRLMQHTLQHSELIGGGSCTDKHCCRFCYRQFSSPAQLQNHQEQVHGPAPSSCMCRICEWAFENEPAFLNHMKSSHKPGEMPYTCQVCSFRSSFYSDVLQHFASFHRESCFLLCVFCLKVTRNPVSYQQHLLRHQVSQAFHCNRCRLQFVLLKDKMQHKLENHRSFRRPKQLEGLPPGSKRKTASPAAPEGPDPLCFCRPCRTSSADGPVVCLECGANVWDFSAHYPTHVHCLLCPYSSCCSRAYASHMIHVFVLRCSHCDFSPLTGDQMAEHLLKTDHHSATCSTFSKSLHEAVGFDLHYLDQAMAPVEDLDYSDEENLDELPDADGTETMKEACVSRETHSVSPSPSTATAKDQEDVLTARQLRIVLFALCSGVQPASRVFSTEPPLIRSWLKEARRRVGQSGQKAADPGSERMAAWVLSMREQQLPISEGALLHKASTLKQKGAFSDSFRISYDWAVSFLLQHQLGPHRAGRTAVLAPPPFLEAKVRAFREFTQRVVRVHGVPETCVAAMDELCLFVDWQQAQDRSRSSEALEFTGSVPAVTVFLTVLADGTALPSLLLTSRPVPPKVLPESVLLEAGPESLSAEDALDLWTNKVWLPHVFAEPRKSVLVLDRHREHLGDQFLTSTAGSLSLLAVIPGGCSWWLQPVEVCLKPALQRLLLCRWTSFVAGNPPQLQDGSPQQLQTHVIQLLVEWLMEALDHLKTLPHMLRRSFQGPPLQPEEVQAHLLKALMEGLLGGEGSQELMESDKESDEGQQGEEEQEGRKKGGTEEETEKQKEESDQCEKVEQGHVRTESGGGQQGGGQEEHMVREDRGEKGDTKSEEEEEKKEHAENRGEETKERITAEVDGKEEEKEEVSKERRETRIVIGEEVGDEWKITVKSRAEEEQRRDGS